MLSIETQCSDRGPITSAYRHRAKPALRLAFTCAASDRHDAPVPGPAQSGGDLPGHKPEDHIGTERSESPPHGVTTVTVLLVEDEPALREIVKRQLTRHGYEVITASDGVEALEAAVGQPVDLVITDVLMPNMKGNELAAQLAAVCPTAKVIFMSGYAPFELDASDMASFLHKPFSEADLLNHIHDALGSDHDPGSAPRRNQF